MANDPTHVFFKRFGEAMPEGDWHHPGTKQGVYMIGPDAEYLEGRFAASSDREDMRARLRRALERWETLRKDKGYRNRPVPEVAATTPPRYADKPLVFAVSLRDLPEGGDDPHAVTRFREEEFNDRNWMSFVKWAWNRNWIAFDDPRVFVPDGKKEQDVDANAVERLCREVLVDNVRGQAPHWRREHLKDVAMTMRRIKTSGSIWTIEYRGKAHMDAGEQQYSGTLYGQADWSTKEHRFTRFEIVALGTRQGAWQFNQRARDKGPAPIGIALRLHQD